MEPKRILNEDSWQADRHWLCPHCSCKNDLSVWMEEERCQDCGRIQRFESDYVDAYEGIIATIYLGPGSQ